MPSRIHSRFHGAFRFFAASFALLFAGAHAAQAATPESFHGLKVEVVGEGRPVLMIPGLNSAGEVWDATCAALQQDQVQCHIVTLPGFAGLAPAADARSDAWLEDMRDRLLAYVQARKLERPVVIGHSLGGVLALQMAASQADAIDRLVIVDALPFLAAAQNPAATVESTRPAAQAMRAGMLAQDESDYRATITATVKNMTRDPARVDTLVEWGNASDRATTTEAMYAMMTTDLRDTLAGIRVPVLVLGSWAAYAPFGATADSTAMLYRAQYAGLDGVQIEMSEDGYHFLMWDDPQWLQQQVRGFITDGQ